MKNRLFALLLCLVLISSLVSCSDKNPTVTDVTDTAENSKAPETVSAFSEVEQTEVVASVVEYESKVTVASNSEKASSVISTISEEKPLEYIGELDTISDQEFIDLVDNYDNRIYKSLYEMDGKEYGRVISSSVSKEDAVRVCTRHFTDERYPEHKNTVTECKVIYESDILYGVNVKWVVRGYQYEENVISFKRAVADITVNNVIYGDKETIRIHTMAKETIGKIVMYMAHNKYYQTVLDYELITNSQDYTTVIIYTCFISYGDWGIRDEYNLLKHTVVVHKANGHAEFQEPITLKSVYK